MLDLRIWMICFGLFIGVAFPFAVVLLGVARRTAMRPAFFVATIIAGLIVALINYFLAHAVVGVRVRSLASGMHRVENTFLDATLSGDWSGCDPESCKVPIDSNDDLGEVATSFNRLVDSLTFSHEVSGGVRAVSEVLAAHLDLATLADTTMAELMVRTQCDAVCLLVASHGRVEVAGARGIHDASALAASDQVRTVLRTARGVTLTLPSDVVIAGSLVDFVPSEVHVLPIRYGPVSVGVLVVGFATASSAGATSVLTSSLPGLAVALNNALNHEDLQRVAALDPLTGVYNRRFGLQRLSEEFARAVRSGDPLGVMMLDLDHFKAINDTYGHLVGDRVLESVSRNARRVLREGDVLLRYGGEEFLIIFPGAGPGDLAQMAERIRRVIADSSVVEGGQNVAVTVSIGASGLPNQIITGPEELVGAADAALYHAKESGRDRWVIG
jgi:diguanylate cyclase (GGDEF)-like protein